MKLKKIAAALLTGVLALGTIVGCGSNDNSNANASNNTGSTNSQSTSDSATSDNTVTVVEENEDLVTVRIGMLSGHALPVIAQQHGYFEEEGIEVELYIFSAGAPEIEAFTAGELDIVHTGDLPFFNAIRNGVDIVAIGTYSSSEKVNGLIVRDDANIESFADLEGKKVSVPIGSNIQSLLYEYLEAGGLTGDDVEIFNLVGNDAVNALANGDIDAAVLWEPFLSTAPNTIEGITYFADTTEFRTFVCPISSSSKFIEEHNTEVEKVLRALQKASQWTTDNKEEAAQEIVEYYGLQDSTSVLISLEVSDHSVGLTEEKIEAIRLGAERNYQYGIINELIDVDQYVDDQFTDRIN